MKPRPKNQHNMPANVEQSKSVSQLDSELYFLISKFLSAGPCRRAAEVLRQELAENKLLQKRLDWEGNEHEQTYENLVEIHRHISADHLKLIVQRLGPLLDKEIKPAVVGVQSLLGAGCQSLLRTHEGTKHVRWKHETYAARLHLKSLLPPKNFVHPANLATVLRSQELSGPTRHDLRLSSQIYTKVSMHGRKLGHLSAVYCVAFDRTGHYIFTGADDHLVKIWRAADGRLLATLRGHAGEITDMAVNYENTILAAGSCDKVIRVWCLKTKSPISVLHAHTGMITSLQFCPLIRGETQFLVSTGADGCVCFWPLNKHTHTFEPKPTKFIERSRAGAQMLCSSFSPGGIFLATGSSDHVIRVYCFTSAKPEKVCELEAHNDRVDSVEYSNHTDRFLSGSRDGTARIWRYERQEWRNIVLNMASQLNMEAPNTQDDKAKDKQTVTMVCWNKDDSRVVTAVSDFTLKVWDSHSGKLLQVLKGHEDEIFVLEHSPSDSRIVLSAGHDGHVIIWDIIRGIKIKSFYNMIEGQGHGAVFDCKFSPDGQAFAATDSHGYLSLFGFGSNEKHSKIPEEVFFHTDYRPLIRDANNYVLDEQTQQAPHLMPPPFLVDIDGNPYPPDLQRLVPGRENCSASQLVPQLAVNEDGDQEVVGEVPGEVVADPPGQEVRDGVGTEEDRPEIDMMIELMQRQQDERLAVERGEPIASPPPMGSPRARSASGRGVGMRRSGETEGVRQSLENVSQRATKSQLAAIKHQVMVKELEPALTRESEEFRKAMADQELKKFIIERKKKPAFGHGEAGGSNASSSHHRHKNGNGPTEETGRNRLNTRALYDTEEEEEEEESSVEDVWDSEKTNGSDSTEYSDWMGDQGSNLQPPQRSSNRQRKKKKISSSESEDTELEVDIEGSEEKQKDKKPPTASRPQRKKQQQKKRQIINNVNGVDQFPEEFRPPRWLTDTIPRKAPYVSQMGDEVIYFRQGHQLYLQAVKRKKEYDVYINKNQPWNKHPNLREQELVKIVGIKYEIKPPRLCCLKLAFLDSETGKATGGTFSIKYHDIPDVIDFLVLKQNYDTAMQRKWKAGDRFRSMIDDAWWTGVIESQAPFQEEYPDSMFQCFVVHWDNGETEKLSPWDMEPIDEEPSVKDSSASEKKQTLTDRFNLFPLPGLPARVTESVEVTQEELKSLMYTPKAGEWPACGRDEECERIIHGIEAIMEHSMAEPFLTPVDLNVFPTYGIVIEYPMDLNTIKARLENHFYRRVNAVQFDVRYIETNAIIFNEPGSLIVRSARMLTETLLRFIGNRECRDIMPLLTELSKGEEFRWDLRNSDSQSDESGDRKGKKAEMRRRRKGGKCRQPVNPDSWREECKDLLTTMVQCQDSEPFRTAVNPLDYPDYRDQIDEPMDLSLVGQNLESQLYSDPLEYSKHVRLIFQNSRTYNTNKRSRIYTMTLRLSAMFEDHMKGIVSKWRAAVKHGKHGKSSAPSKSSRVSSQQSKSLSVMSRSRAGNQPISRDLIDQAGGSSSHSNGHSSSSRTILNNNASSGEDSSGSTTEIENETCGRKTSNPTLRKSSAGLQSLARSGRNSPITNGHSGPYTTRSSTGTRKRKKLTSSSGSSSSSSSSSSSNSDTEIEGLTDVKSRPKRKQPAKKKRARIRKSLSDSGPESASSSNDKSDSSDSDSEEEHSASEKEQQVRRSRRNVAKKNSQSANKSGDNSQTASRSKRRRVLSDDDSADDVDDNGPELGEDDDDDEDYVVAEPKRKTSSRQRKPQCRPTPSQVDSRQESAPRSQRTRNRGVRTVRYQEEDSQEEEDSGQSDDPDRSHVTMSSRGRLRRLTPRARASLMGE